MLTVKEFSPIAFLGDFINNYYFPVFVPIGIIGNIFSFVVSINNRINIVVCNVGCLEASRSHMDVNLRNPLHVSNKKHI